MKTVSITELSTQLPDYLRETKPTDPVIITQDDIPVAILLIPLDDADLERLLLAHSPKFQAMLDQSRQNIQAGHGLSNQQFWEMINQPNESG